jgi:DNA-directed RNA polymerase specialized sigma24 family protein
MEDVHPDTDQIIQNITQEQWLEIFHQLTLYAESCCRKWNWRTGKDNLPKGYSPDAIATEAILRLLDDKRKWNRDAYPGDSPLPFLKSVVDSVIYRLGHSSAHKTAASLEDESKALGSDGDGYPREVEAAQGAAGFRPPPVASPVDKIFVNQVQGLVREAIKDRPDVVSVFEHLRNQLSPAEIAKEMGIPVEEVYAKIRFLRRRTDEIRTKILGWRRPTTPDRKERRATRRRHYGNRNQQ